MARYKFMKEWVVQGSRWRLTMAINAANKANQDHFTTNAFFTITMNGTMQLKLCVPLLLPHLYTTCTFHILFKPQISTYWHECKYKEFLWTVKMNEVMLCDAKFKYLEYRRFSLSSFNPHLLPIKLWGVN